MGSDDFAAVVPVPQGVVQVRIVKHFPKPIYHLPIGPRLIGNHPFNGSQGKREKCVATPLQCRPYGLRADAERQPPARESVTESCRAPIQPLRMLPRCPTRLGQAPRRARPHTGQAGNLSQRTSCGTADVTSRPCGTARTPFPCRDGPASDPSWLRALRLCARVPNVCAWNAFGQLVWLPWACTPNVVLRSGRTTHPAGVRFASLRGRRL